MHSEEKIRAFIGKNADKYLAQFRKFRRDDGSFRFAFTWNWPAFFFSFFWMLYRGMKGWAAVALIAPCLVKNIIVVCILWSDIGVCYHIFNYRDLIAWGLPSIMWGLTANYLYFRRVNRVLTRESKATPPASGMEGQPSVPIAPEAERRGFFNDTMLFLLGMVAGGVVGGIIVGDTTKVTGDLPSVGFGLVILFFILCFAGGMAAVSIGAVIKAISGEGSWAKAAATSVVAAVLMAWSHSSYLEIRQAKAHVQSLAASAELRNCGDTLNAYYSDHNAYPASLDGAKCEHDRDVIFSAARLTKDEFIILASHTKAAGYEYMIRSDMTGVVRITDKLVRAVVVGNAVEVAELTAHGANVNQQDKTGRTPLMYAVRGRDTEIAKRLLDAGADIHRSASYGETALFDAIDFGSAELVKLLVERGANVNEEGWYGITPLIKAAENGDIETVKVLLKKGADMTTKSQHDTLEARLRGPGLAEVGAIARPDGGKGRGLTALEAAIKNKHSDIARLLRQAGARE